MDTQSLPRCLVSPLGLCPFGWKACTTTPVEALCLTGNNVPLTLSTISPKTMVSSSSLMSGLLFSNLLSDDDSDEPIGGISDNEGEHDERAGLAEDAKGAAARQVRH